MNVDNSEVITVLSLCSGYGGIELGLADALQNPMRVVAVEVEAYALANLVAKAEEGKLAVETLWPDLRTFPAKRFRGCFDIITAGYPCQPFSVAGKRQGEKDNRHLWPDIARIIKAVEPIWCFFENVAGHLTLGFPTVYRSLRKMGYTVEAGLFTAAEVGAPHKRERLFILANAGGGRCERSQKKVCSGRDAANCSSELADSEYPGQGQGVIEKAQTGIGRAGLAINGAIMADTTLANSTRKRQLRNNISGPESETVPYTNGKGLEESRAPRPKKTCPGTIGYWPARPGQQQYKWEEPRVVGDTRSGVSNAGRTRWARKGIDERPQSQQQQAQSRLGRAADGPAGRVDRLRLLGNGVVPQQAAKAFTVLMKLYD